MLFSASGFRHHIEFVLHCRKNIYNFEAWPISGKVTKAIGKISQASYKEIIPWLLLKGQIDP